MSAAARSKAKVPLLYLDTLVFLNVIKRERGFWADSYKILLAAERNDIQLVASTLVLVEVGSHKGDIDPLKRNEVIERYLVNAPVRWYELDLFVAEEARRLCGTHQLRGADAAHLATAIRAKADYFVTHDTDFPLGKTVSGVEVIKPRLLWNPTLEDEQVDKEAAEHP
ncbi:MAG TPA: type II toxin-antitoxin system VapC family toxin [Micromonospora sp.]|nr:type II toxin-antitoxin system VapC family toxin [Micromonospora sp.]